jgi:hypothetical protein
LGRQVKRALVAGKPLAGAVPGWVFALWDGEDGFRASSARQKKSHSPILVFLQKFKSSKIANH